ncbi:hypothetical protein [Ideonella sp.]|uniref:hypothetical protein n=1 Tax=Ideonella sp. TaxID=1929293 RepID=UPI0035AE1676
MITPADFLGAWRVAAVAVACLAVAGPAAAQAGSVYYICPGNVFTNTITAKEAEARGCKAREAQQPTTIAGPKPRPVQGAAPSSGPKTDRVDSAEQRARDTDARRILETELRQAEERLEALRREYNNGEPERRGDEVRNAQRYLDRVAELKAAITRQEADVAALRRELAKLPS